MPVVAELCHSGVQIHAKNPCVGKKPRKLILHLLRAAAGIHDVFAAAGVTDDGCRFAVTAIVAHKLSVGLVINKRNIAPRALLDRSAANTPCHRVIAPSVHKQNGLFAVLKVIFQLLRQRLAEHTRVSAHGFFAHIHNHRIRKLGVAIALFHFKKPVFSCLSTVKGFYGGRCGSEHQRNFQL